MNHADDEPQQETGVLQEPRQASPNGFKRYVDTFFRHWVIALIPIVVLPAVAIGVGLKSHKNSTVVTNVWVSQASTSQLGYLAPYASPAANAQAELNQLLQTQRFDLQVARKSPLYWRLASAQPYRNIWIVKDMSKNVKVTTGGSNLLAITYSPKKNPVGTQLLHSILLIAPTQIKNLYQQQSVDRVQFLTTQLQQASARLSQANSALAGYLLDHHIAASQITQQILVNPSLAALYDAQQTAQSNDQAAKAQYNQGQPAGGLGSALTVIDNPTVVPASASKKALILDAGIGLVIGLLLSCAFVATATLRDRSLRHAYEVPAVIGLPILASIPYSRKAVSGRGRQQDSTAGGLEQAS